MGYSTQFEGGLRFNRELTHKEWLELRKLSGTDDIALLGRYTATPETIPEGYLQWQPNDEGTQYVWDAGEKFYHYIHWLRWVIKHYFAPRDIVLNGEIQWQGEDMEDRGIIVAIDNKITTKKLTVEGLVECPDCGKRFVA